MMFATSSMVSRRAGCGRGILGVHAPTRSHLSQRRTLMYFLHHRRRCGRSPNAAPPPSSSSSPEWLPHSFWSSQQHKHHNESSKIPHFYPWAGWGMNLIKDAKVRMMDMHLNSLKATKGNYAFYRRYEESLGRMRSSHRIEREEQEANDLWAKMQEKMAKVRKVQHLKQAAMAQKLEEAIERRQKYAEMLSEDFLGRSILRHAWGSKPQPKNAEPGSADVQASTVPLASSAVRETKAPVTAANIVSKVEELDDDTELDLITLRRVKKTLPAQPHELFDNLLVQPPTKTVLNEVDTYGRSQNLFAEKQNLVEFPTKTEDKERQLSASLTISSSSVLESADSKSDTAQAASGSETELSIRSTTQNSAATLEKVPDLTAGHHDPLQMLSNASTESSTESRIDPVINSRDLLLARIQQNVFKRRAALANLRPPNFENSSTKINHSDVESDETIASLNNRCVLPPQASGPTNTVVNIEQDRLGIPDTSFAPLSKDVSEGPGTALPLYSESSMKETVANTSQMDSQQERMSEIRNHAMPIELQSIAKLNKTEDPLEVHEAGKQIEEFRIVGNGEERQNQPIEPVGERIYSPQSMNNLAEMQQKAIEIILIPTLQRLAHSAKHIGSRAHIIKLLDSLKNERMSIMELEKAIEELPLHDSEKISGSKLYEEGPIIDRFEQPNVHKIDGQPNIEVPKEEKIEETSYLYLNTQQVTPSIDAQAPEQIIASRFQHPPVNEIKIAPTPTSDILSTPVADVSQIESKPTKPSPATELASLLFWDKKRGTLPDEEALSPEALAYLREAKTKQNAASEDSEKNSRSKAKNALIVGAATMVGIYTVGVGRKLLNPAPEPASPTPTFVAAMENLF